MFIFNFIGSFIQQMFSSILLRFYIQSLFPMKQIYFVLFNLWALKNGSMNAGAALWSTWRAALSSHHQRARHHHALGDFSLSIRYSPFSVQISWLIPLHNKARLFVHSFIFNVFLMSRKANSTRQQSFFCTVNPTHLPPTPPQQPPNKPKESDPVTRCSHQNRCSFWVVISSGLFEMVSGWAAFRNCVQQFLGLKALA